MPVSLAQVVTCINKPRCRNQMVFPLRITIPDMHKELLEAGWVVNDIKGIPAPEHICPFCKEKMK